MRLLTATLLSLTIALMASTAAAAAGSGSSFYKTLELRDDFQTDSRRQLKTTGKVEWSKGQLTLKPGASFEKPLNAGPQVDCELKVDFGNASANGLVSETTIVFEVQDTLDGLRSLQTASGVSMCAEIRVERAGRALQAVVRVSQFPRKNDEFARSKYSFERFRVPIVTRRIELPASAQGFVWNVSYNHGLVLFSSGGQEQAAGWRQNFVANVTSLRVIQTHGDWSCRGLTFHGKERPPAMNAFLLAQLMPVAAGDIRAFRLWKSGRYLEALTGLKQSYDISRKVFGPEHFYTIASQGNLASIYQDIGDYARAEQLYRENMILGRKVYGVIHPEFSVGMANLALLYMSLADFARAEPLLVEAVKQYRLVCGDEYPDTAALISLLGGLYARTGDSARAESCYTQALAARKKIFGDSGIETAWSLEELGDLCIGRSDYSRAQQLYQQALQILTKAYGLESGHCALLVNKLGLLHVQLGHFDQAQRNFGQAISIRKRVVGSDSPAYAMSLLNLGVLYERMGDDARAEPLCRQSLEIIEKNVDRTNGILCERQQLEWMASERYVLDVYLDLGDRANINADERYRHCLQWKGAVFAAQVQMRILRENPELAGVFAELQSVSGQLAAVSFLRPDSKQLESWKRQIHDLTEKKESIERDLAEKSVEYRHQRASLQVRPDQVRTALAGDVALIDFLECTRQAHSAETQGRVKRQPHLVAFIVRRDRATQFLDLGPIGPIHNNVETWRQTYGTSPEALNAAIFLKKAVWEPLEKHLNGVATVLLSPDGDLARFPMGALPGKKEGSYLIEDLDLVVAPVPRLLAEVASSRREKQQGQTALLIGDVAFDADPRRQTPTDVTNTLLADATRRAAVRSANIYFPALPGSVTEIEEISALHARQFGADRQTVLRRSQATEEAFRTQAPRCTYLHLATHGFFQSVSESHHEFMSFDDRDRVASFHPGLQCGLALAGANHKTADAPTGARIRDDGILTAVEVASLDLRNVELVTLSACETGLGKAASGEGVLGLQRAFQMAGARNVVASLWKVDDQGTAALMQLFYYKLWVEKKRPATALREAQLAIIRNPDQTEMLAATRGPVFEKVVKLTDHRPRSSARRNASPGLWAAFILSGDWR